jgi:hypothetical protein
VTRFFFAVLPLEIAAVEDRREPSGTFARVDRR